MADRSALEEIRQGILERLRLAKSRVSVQEKATADLAARRAALGHYAADTDLPLRHARADVSRYERQLAAMDEAIGWCDWAPRTPPAPPESGVSGDFERREAG